MHDSCNQLCSSIRTVICALACWGWGGMHIKQATYAISTRHCSCTRGARSGRSDVGEDGGTCTVPSSSSVSGMCASNPSATCCIPSLLPVSTASFVARANCAVAGSTLHLPLPCSVVSRMPLPHTCRVAMPWQGATLCRVPVSLPPPHAGFAVIQVKIRFSSKLLNNFERNVERQQFHIPKTAGGNFRYVKSFISFIYRNRRQFSVCKILYLPYMLKVE